MTGDKPDKLESLRQEMRTITGEIMKKVSRRMEIAREIGEIKGNLRLKVKDEKAERELRLAMGMLADEFGLRREFASRLLNVLLNESEAAQLLNRLPQDGRKKTHLSVFARARELEAAGNSMIHMEVGEPDFPPPAAVGVSLTDSLRSRRYHYTETVGISGLRQAIAKLERTNEKNVIVTPGGRFAVFCAITGLLKSGDELIVIEPAWPAYGDCAEFIGANVRTLRTQFVDSWHPNIAELERMVTASTKMIAINYPNNPTGKIVDKNTARQIVELAENHNLYLLSDEVYSHYAYTPFESFSNFNYARCIVVQSFSKTYAMTGFRIGYAIADPEIITSMRNVQSIGITSVAEPVQYAAISALTQDTSSNSRLIKDRLDFLCARLKGMDLNYVMPEGAMYVFPALPEGYHDLEFIEMLLKKGVAVAPGSGFGNSYDNFIRLSACQPLDVLTKGLDVIEKTLQLEKGQ